MIRFAIFVLCFVPVCLHSQWAWTGYIKIDTIGQYVCRYNRVTHSDNDTITYNFKIYCGSPDDRFDREYDLGAELDTFIKLLEQITLESDSFKNAVNIEIEKPHIEMSTVDRHLEIPTWNYPAKCMISLTWGESMELLNWLYAIRSDNVTRPRNTGKKKR